MFKKSVFIFRRDLRLQDNIALTYICKHSEIVIPIFIFDPFQIKTHRKNKNYISNNAIQFMCESLDDLDDQLRRKGSRLFYFYGKPWSVIENLVKSDEDIECIAFNLDYSKYSISRDNKIKKVCDQYDVQNVMYEYDSILHNNKKILKANGDMYVVFSAFYKNALKYPVTPVFKNTYKNYLAKRNKLSREFHCDIHKFYKPNNNVYVHGGRQEAIKILKGIKRLKNYNKCRDILSYDTSRLSAYLKFGCISIRECHSIFKKTLSARNELIKQLYWRSFYFLISQYVRNDYDKFIDSRFSRIKWQNSSVMWKKMWTGNTGFLALDATVRELNTTGFMHNRGRLLTGNFSVKILRINPFHPTWGGQVYFSKMLIDGCFANNSGNYSWVTSDKLDPSGMRFGKGISGRVFDPRKFKKWDPECHYIKKWLPKLKNIPNRELFNWDKYCHKYKELHPCPMIDFDKRKKEWVKIASKY